MGGRYITTCMRLCLVGLLNEGGGADMELPGVAYTDGPLWPAALGSGE